MDEAEFYSSRNLRPFGTAAFAEWEARQRRFTQLALTLGSALWGTTPDDLRRQLAASHPEIPTGFDLTDFRELREMTERMALALSKLRHLAPGIAATDPNVWAARAEIVRRAVDHLENR